METANLLTVLTATTLVAGIGIGSMIWAYVGAGSVVVLFQDPISPSSQTSADDSAKAFQQGCLAYKAGQYRAAIEHFNQVIQLNATFAEAFHNRGLAFANLRRDDDATRNLLKASELYLERGDRSSMTVIKQNLEALKQRKQAREAAKQKR